MPMFLNLLCVSMVLAATAVEAVDKSPPATPSRTKRDKAHDNGKTKRRSKSPLVFTPEREAAAIEFVRRHHPELADLLAHLKRTEAAEYHRAVGTLFRASERLARIQERNPEKYERELRAWKLKSHIQLLTAQIRMAPKSNKKLRQKLEQALLEQFDLRTAQLVEDRKKFVDRAEKLKTQIDRRKKERHSQVEKQVEMLLRDKKKRPGQSERADKGQGRGKNGGSRAAKP